MATVRVCTGKIVAMDPRTAVRALALLTVCAALVVAAHMDTPGARATHGFVALSLLALLMSGRPHALK